MPPSPTDGDGAGPSDPLASCERRGLRARRALISPSKHDRAAGVVISPSSFSAVAGWSNTTADDDTDPVSALANVADRARAPMAAVRLPAAGPAHRSKGLSEGAAPSGGAGLVMVNPAGTSVWASSARRASTAGDSPGRAVVVVAPGALPVVADVGGAVVAVLDGSGGGGAVSGLAASGPGPTASEWTAEWAPRA